MLLESSKGKNLSITVPSRQAQRVQLERSAKPNHLNLFEKSSLNFTEVPQQVAKRAGPTYIAKKHKGTRSLQHDALKRINCAQNKSEYDDKPASTLTSSRMGNAAKTALRTTSALDRGSPGATLKVNNLDADFTLDRQCSIVVFDPDLMQK